MSLNNQIAFTPSSNPNADYLKGEEKAFKLDSNGLLYPFSKPETWMELVKQGTIVDLSKLKADTLDPIIDDFQSKKDYKGLQAYLEEYHRQEGGINWLKKLVDEEKKSKEGSNSNPSYSIEIKKGIYKLYNENGDYTKSKIASELGISPPTVTSAIKKVEELLSKENLK